MCFSWLLTLDESEDLWAIDVVSASIDDGVTDFTNEDYKSRRSVVVVGIVPDQLGGVHDWNEQVNSLGEFY